MVKKIHQLFLIIFISIFSLGFLINTGAQATDFQYDLGFGNKDIFLSKENLIAGDKVRIYATIHNYGTEDVSGYVTFYQGDILIQDSQVISVRSGGLSDEVFIDWTVPQNEFNIRATIQGQEPQDDNNTNDVAVTGFFKPKKDGDSDGVIDEEDNCPEAVNENQMDSDEDGFGDVCDDDDDNDGILDYQESIEKVSDDQDIAEVSEEEVVKVVDYNEQNQPISSNALPTSRSKISEDLPENILEESNSYEKEQEILFREANPDEGGNKESFVLSRVHISSEKRDWKTFSFSAETNLALADRVDYQWIFDDGAEAEGLTVDYGFKGPGEYQVMVKAVDRQTGVIATDSIQINISFFHLANWQLWLLLLGLIFLASFSLYSLEKNYLFSNKLKQLFKGKTFEE